MLIPSAITQETVSMDVGINRLYVVCNMAYMIHYMWNRL